MEAAAEWDPEAPSLARIWNGWLGGTNLNTVDQVRAAEFEAALPSIALMARNARTFTGNVTAWAASQGIGQFLEMGCGLPPRHVHEYAREVLPDARVAYVDWDVGVTDELPMLLGLPAAVHDGLAVIAADLQDPGRVLSRQNAGTVIDLSMRACVLLVGVMNTMTPSEKADLVAAYAERLATGSLVAVTALAIPGAMERQKMARLSAPGTRYDVSPEEFRELFGSLEMVPPGIAVAQCLRPGMGEAPGIPRGAHVLAGVGCKGGI
jgi:S-adenosyl methyltransferase